MWAVTRSTEEFKKRGDRFLGKATVGDNGMELRAQPEIQPVACCGSGGLSRGQSTPLTVPVTPGGSRGSGGFVLAWPGRSRQPFRSCLVGCFLWMFFGVLGRIRKCALNRAIQFWFFFVFIVSTELSKSSSVPTALGVGVPNPAFLNICVLMQMFITLLAALLAKVNVSIKIISVSLTFKTPNAFLHPCGIIKC